MSIFIDTGGWIAVAVKKDRYHEVAENYYTQLLHRNEKLFARLTDAKGLRSHF